MNENDSAFEPQAIAGPSGESRKRKRSSSSSSTSSSSSSSSSSADRNRRSRRRKHKKSKRGRRSESRMDLLFKEMGELRKIINNSNKNDNDRLDSVLIYPDGESYKQLDPEHEFRDNDTFAFDIETKLKEPAVPKTPDNFLKMLSDAQRLGSTSWSDVRYAETQKLYNHTPGFTDLETNDEVKMFEGSHRLLSADKSYAAITFCLFKQKVTLQEGICDLLSWAKNSNVNADNLSGKLDELFLKGDFFKISSDLLQIVCGHRAESVELRREEVLSQACDPLVKATLKRIPPSATHIFDPEPFTSTLEKLGGVHKSFWSVKSSHPLRTKPKQANHRPAQGRGDLPARVPSRETLCGIKNAYKYGTHSHQCDYPPAQGETSFANYPPPLHQTQHPYVNRDIRSFQNRGSWLNRGSNRGRGNARRASRGGHSYNRRQ